MKALIVYSSWFGHNRAIAGLLAGELRRHGVTVACKPVKDVLNSEIGGYDMLVLGTYTHHGRASHGLRLLIEGTLTRQLQRMSIAAFGTQVFDSPAYHHPGGVDDLELALAARGCDLAVPPLRIGLRGLARFAPWLGIGKHERAAIRAFAADLWDASVPAALI